MRQGRNLAYLVHDCTTAVLCIFQLSPHLTPVNACQPTPVRYFPESTPKRLIEGVLPQILEQVSWQLCGPRREEATVALQAVAHISYSYQHTVSVFILFCCELDDKKIGLLLCVRSSQDRAGCV